MNITALVGRTLQWTQPRMFHEEYQLQDGGEVLGTLVFRSMWGTLATAKLAGGCWTFKRLGFLQTRATVRRCDEEGDVATFRNTTWTGGGTLEFADGRAYRISVNFWQSRFEITDADDQPLVRYWTEGFVRMSGKMEILAAAAAHEDVPGMMMLGWYLAVMMYRDAAASA